MFTNFTYILTLYLLSCQMLHLTTADSVDCSKLPNSIRPQECCNFPELFKQNVLDYCKEKQQQQVEQCYYKCIFEATEIFRKDEFSYPKAEDYIDWVMKPENEFSLIYKNAYRKCINIGETETKKLSGFLLKQIRLSVVKLIQINIKDEGHNFTDQNGCSALPEMVISCVENEIFEHCPKDHWNLDVESCKIMRDFIHNCLR